MANFKLKKEARQFFEPHYHEYIKPYKFWEGAMIHTNLLEEVPKVYIDYGHKKYSSVKDLKSWDEDKTSLMFTIRLSNLTHKEYENIRIAPLMDEIQKVVDKHFEYLK